MKNENRAGRAGMTCPVFNFFHYLPISVGRCSRARSGGRSLGMRKVDGNSKGEVRFHLFIDLPRSLNFRITLLPFSATLTFSTLSCSHSCAAGEEKFVLMQKSNSGNHNSGQGKCGVETRVFTHQFLTIPICSECVKKTEVSGHGVAVT